MVFYGSQTGTAEEFAGRLAKDCVSYGMKGMVVDPEECDMVRGMRKKQGPVVQSIVSLTSLFRGQLIKCFMTL